MRDLGRLGLLVFAPILLLTGASGFFIAPAQSAMSVAPAYNVFHLVFGAIGLGCALSRRAKAIRAFNLGFGLIDLYQAVASAMHWFPVELFRWKRADDVLHVVIGLALVALGLLTRGKPSDA